MRNMQRKLTMTSLAVCPQTSGFCHQGAIEAQYAGRCNATRCTGETDDMCRPGAVQFCRIRCDWRLLPSDVARPLLEDIWVFEKAQFFDTIDTGEET